MSIQTTGTASNPRILAQATIDYIAQGAIADIALRPLPVQDQKGLLVAVGQKPDDLDLALAPGANYQRGNTDARTIQYEVAKYGVEESISDENQEHWSVNFSAAQAAMINARNRLALGREKRVATLLQNTATFAAGNNNFIDASAAPWATAGSDIIGPCQDAQNMIIANSGIEGNVLIIDQTTMRNLMANTQLRNSLVNVQVPTVDAVKMAIASLVGVEDVIVSSLSYAGSNGYIWGDGYAMIAKVAKSDASYEMSVGRSPRWFVSKNVDVDTKIYREDQTDSNIVKVRSYEAEVIMNAGLGVLIDIKA